MAKNTHCKLEEHWQPPFHSQCISPLPLDAFGQVADGSEPSRPHRNGSMFSFGPRVRNCLRTVCWMLHRRLLAEVAITSRLLREQCP